MRLGSWWNWSERKRWTVENYRRRWRRRWGGRILRCRLSCCSSACRTWRAARPYHRRRPCCTSRACTANCWRKRCCPCWRRISGHSAASSLRSNTPVTMISSLVKCYVTSEPIFRHKFAFWASKLVRIWSLRSTFFVGRAKFVQILGFEGQNLPKIWFF